MSKKDHPLDWVVNNPLSNELRDKTLGGLQSYFKQHKLGPMEQLTTTVQVFKIASMIHQLRDSLADGIDVMPLLETADILAQGLQQIDKMMPDEVRQAINDIKPEEMSKGTFLDKVKAAAKIKLN
jgi:hypothetical protein